MATVRFKFGTQTSCAKCGADIEYHGARAGWLDRGSGTECLPYEDRKLNEIVHPVGKHRPYGVKLTLRDAKRELAEHGIAISKGDDDYRVNFRGGREATAYYTNDIDDAVTTGIRMAAEGRR